MHLAAAADCPAEPRRKTRTIPQIAAVSSRSEVGEGKSEKAERIDRFGQSIESSVRNDIDIAR